MDRYKDMPDRHTVLCRDCSTRSSGVLIPREEIPEHDAWHAEQAQ